MNDPQQWPENIFHTRVEHLTSLGIEPCIELKELAMVWEEAVFSTLQHVLGERQHYDLLHRTVCQALVEKYGKIEATEDDNQIFLFLEDAE